MLEDFRLQVFVTLAAQKSFTKAAVCLGITQPAVSQHVMELEKQVGVKLFERLHGETVLTPSGEVFLKYAERILDDYHSTSLLFSPMEPALIGLSVPSEIRDYVLTDFFHDFMLLHPEIIVQEVHPDEADLKISLEPVYNERGMFTIGLHPSESFASTELWKVLQESVS